MKASFWFCFALLLGAYTLTYEPFCFVEVVSPSYRLLIESSVLLILLLLLLIKNRSAFLHPSFLVFPLLAFWFLYAGPSSTEHPGFALKIAILVVGSQALRSSPGLAQYLARAWVFLWTLICIQILLAAVGYFLGLVHFSPIGTLGVFGGVGDRLFNPLFGFLGFRGLFGITFYKFSEYFPESLFFGLFSGLNLCAAGSLLPKEHVLKFRLLNLITGFLSGSIAFFFFFSSLAIYELIKKQLRQVKGKSKVALVVLSLVIMIAFMIALMVGSGVSGSSSLSDRVLRISMALDALVHSSAHAFWFGNYNYGETVGAGAAAGCGLLSFFLQRGLILYLPMLYLFYKYARRNRFVLAYLFYYSLLLEYFWWPAFILFLILIDSVSSQTQTNSPLKQPSSS